MGGSRGLEPATGTRVFLLPGALLRSGDVLPAVASRACLVCGPPPENPALPFAGARHPCGRRLLLGAGNQTVACAVSAASRLISDRKSTRLNSSHMSISYAVFCLKKKKIKYSYNKAS